MSERSWSLGGDALIVSDVKKRVMEAVRESGSCSQDVETVTVRVGQKGSWNSCWLKGRYGSLVCCERRQK